MVTVKTCTGCGLDKAITEFYKKTPKRHHARCKACMNEYRKARYSETRTREQAVNAKYYDENKELWRTRHKEYYQDNKEKVAERAKRRRSKPETKAKEALYRIRVRRKTRAYMKARYRRDVEKSRERGRAAYLRYKASWIIQNHKRRARTSETFTTAEWEKLKADTGQKCLRCGKPETECRLTMDHVIPLILGGRNILENIQPLCSKCNRWKWNRAIDYRPKSHDQRPGTPRGIQKIQPTPVRE